MIPREDGDQRLLQNQLECEIGVRLATQEGDVDPSLLQVLGERDREAARHPDLDLGQFVAENAGRGREPGGLLSRQKADGENRLGGTRGAARGLGGRFGLRQRQAGVIQKGAAGGRQFDAAHAAGEKRSADFLLEVPHLAAEGGLRRMQAAFRCELHAAGLGDSDEITKMPQLHALVLYLLGIPVNLQSLFQRERRALFERRNANGANGMRMAVRANCVWVEPRSSLRAKRSNPGERRVPYGLLDRRVAALLAMTILSERTASPLLSGRDDVLPTTAAV